MILAEKTVGLSKSEGKAQSSNTIEIPNFSEVLMVTFAEGGAQSQVSIETTMKHMNMVFCDWLIATSNLLIERIGSDSALSATRIHAQHAGMAIVLNVKHRIGLRDGYTTAAYAGHFALCCMGFEIKSEIKEDGTCSELTRCRISNPSSELCLQHFIDMPKGFCSMTAPDFEPVLVSWMGRGDATCKWVIKRKTVSVESVMDQISLGEFLPPPMNDEEKLLWEFSYWSEWWIFWLKELVERVGLEKTLSLLKFSIEDSAGNYVGKIKKELKTIPQGPQGIATIMQLIDDGMHRQGRVVMSDKHKIEMEITKCPFSETTEAVCRFCEAFNNAVCASLDPSLVYSFDRKATDGHGSCLWRIETKNEQGHRSLDPQDTVKRLTEKFIDGEITEEELEKKVSALRRLGLI